MKIPLSHYAERLWSHAARRNDVNHQARQKGNSIHWVIRKDDWTALRWCYVTEYDDGVIRFTKCPRSRPPKTLWPLDIDPCLERDLEITLAASELDEDKFEPLAEVFSYPERARDWALLQQMTTETNLWSEAAVIAERQAREARKTRKRISLASSPAATRLSRRVGLREDHER
jgi:hypothetical protein